MGPLPMKGQVSTEPRLDGKYATPFIGADASVVRSSRRMSMNILKQPEAERAALQSFGNNQMKDLTRERDEKYKKLKNRYETTLRRCAEDKEKAEGAERQFELDLRMKDRELKKVEAEMEMMREVAKDRYNRLLKRCEQLERMYDEAVGPGGPAETNKRTLALEEEILRL